MVRTEGRGGAGRSVYKSVAAWRVETKASGGGSGRFRCQRALRGEGEEDDREWKGSSGREGVGRVCSASAAPSDLALGGRDLRRCARVGELVQSRRLHLVLCSLLQVFISPFSSHKQKSSTCIARYILVVVRGAGHRSRLLTL